MLARNLSKRGGPGKLRSHWEQKVHDILYQKMDLSIYEVITEGRKGSTFHRMCCCLVTSCKVIFQYLIPRVPKRGEGQSLLLKKRGTSAWLWQWKATRCLDQFRFSHFRSPDKWHDLVNDFLCVVVCSFCRLHSHVEITPHRCSRYALLTRPLCCCFWSRLSESLLNREKSTNKQTDVSVQPTGKSSVLANQNARFPKAML